MILEKLIEKKCEMCEAQLKIINENKRVILCEERRLSNLDYEKDQARVSVRAGMYNAIIGVIVSNPLMPEISNHSEF